MVLSPSHKKIIGFSFGTSLPNGLACFLHNTFNNLLEVSVFLPDKQAVFSFQEAFLETEKTTFLPRFFSIADMASDHPSLHSQIEALPKPLSEIKRFTLMVNLLKSKFPTHSSWIYALSKSTLKLLDELYLTHGHVLPLKTESLLSNQEKCLQEFILSAWPNILKENEAIDYYEYEKECLLILKNHLEKNFQDKPVILLGRIDFSHSFKTLMRIVLKLPYGMLALEGFDETCFQETPFSLTHPQRIWQELIKVLSINKEACAFYDNKPERKALIEASFSSFCPSYPLKNKNLPYLIEAKNLFEEAKLIALLVRYHLSKEEKKITIICPDVTFQKRLEGELTALSVSFETSTGIPLSQTLKGLFLLKLLRLFEAFSLRDLINFFKHPLFLYSHPKKRLEHLENTRLLEIYSQKFINYSFESATKHIKDFYPSLFSWWEKATDFLLDNKFSLINLFKKAAHLCGESAFETSFLWKEEDGQSLKLFYDRMTSLFSFLPSQELEEFMTVHPSVHKTRKEAVSVKIEGISGCSLSKNEVLILACLNQGSWPKIPSFTSWNRKNLNLPSLDIFVSLSAYYFSSCFHANHLYLTRSQEDSTGPSIPSSFYKRIQAVVHAQGMSIPSLDLSFKNSLLYFERKNLKPFEERITNASPPLFARPSRLTISDIELLIKDPYGFYAKRILNIKPLAYTSSYQERGILFHQLLFSLLSKKNLLSPLPLIEELFTHENCFIKRQILRVSDYLMKKWEKENLPKREGEISKFLTLNLNQKNLIISGRLDRVDFYEDGTLSVIDYKTGTPPSKKDVMLGYSPQLLLEALMINYAEEGEVKNVIFEHLKGTEPIVDFTDIPLSKDNLLSFENSLKQFLTEFFCLPTPFLACPDPAHKPRYNAYSHLERLRD